MFDTGDEGGWDLFPFMNCVWSTDQKAMSSTSSAASVWEAPDIADVDALG